ncbi:MAG TPA: hypothetical protein VE944_28435 [Nostoc sp.]|uniref:hypothetical protein n=1 Tax=Nostoc sp. TaxID=1180 RepID=UPI002D228216|nr:hypothetical protein [Nostoc sp.]HYX18226.1 hypothetical protein [Nostoc sp.]
MPKKLDAELLARIEEIYLGDHGQTYSTLAKKFQVGLSTLEREGRKRNWAQKREQQSSDKLLKQSAIVSESLARLSPNVLAEFDQFSQKRLLKIIQKGLLVFESVIDQNADNPRVLASLAGGISKLVEVHLKLQPLTPADLVEILIKLDIGPEEFLSELRQQKQAKLTASQN